MLYVCWVSCGLSLDAAAGCRGVGGGVKSEADLEGVKDRYGFVFLDARRTTSRRPSGSGLESGAQGLEKVKIEKTLPSAGADIGEILGVYMDHLWRLSVEMPWSTF